VFDLVRKHIAANGAAGPVSGVTIPVVSAERANEADGGALHHPGGLARRQYSRHWSWSASTLRPGKFTWLEGERAAA